MSVAHWIEKMHIFELILVTPGCMRSNLTTYVSYIQKRCTYLTWPPLYFYKMASIKMDYFYTLNLAQRAVKNPAKGESLRKPGNCNINCKWSKFEAGISQVMWHQTRPNSRTHSLIQAVLSIVCENLGWFNATRPEISQFHIRVTCSLCCNCH